MSTGQFPPSSPFLDHHQEEDIDPFSSISTKQHQSKKFIINSPFNKNSINKSNELIYPTPNPSSSTGVRSSSPARHEVQKTIAISPSDEATMEYRSPLQDVLRARVSSNGATTTLGRSSRCDYFIRSKYASRVHLRMQFNSSNQELTIQCKGFNGCIINFGKEVHGYIKQISSQQYYFQIVSASEVKSDDEIFHDVSLFRDEQITVPYNDNLTFDIKGHITKVDVVEYDESETEDELPVLDSRLSSVEPVVERVEINKVGKDEVKKVEIKQAETKESVQPIEEVAKPAEKLVAVKEAKPIEEVEKVEKTKPVESETKPIVKAPEQREVKEIEPTQAPKSTKRSKSPEQKTIPLQPRSDSSLNKHPDQNRRRKAEPGLSPQKKKPQTIKHQQPKEKISQLNIKEIISNISNLEEVSNILINHLAFSRLSQTPLYQLQPVSPVTQNLSRTQLRAVLFNIDCIGTIYRKGKDAAGKPLDEEYYYDLENDRDFERKELVSSVKGSSSGLRNCRKVHKQYFWKKPTK